MDDKSQREIIAPGPIQSPQYPKTRPGFAFGLYILVRADAFEDTVDRIARGIHMRRQTNVRILDTGVFRKAGFGFIVMEWLECEIDPVRLIAMQEDEKYIDYLVYMRSLKSDEENETYLDVREMTRKVKENNEKS